MWCLLNTDLFLLMLLLVDLLHSSDMRELLLRLIDLLLDLGCSLKGFL